VRRFEHHDGGSWDVVVGRESWGAFFAIFVPVVPGGVVRQVALDATSMEDADRLLDGLDVDALVALLDKSQTKDLG
jgi:hypothetical protein